MARKSATDTPGNGAQLAKLLNLTLPQCYNLANSGTIPAPDNGVWNITACAHAYIKYLQGRAGEEKRDYAVERTRLTKAQADKVEMEIKVLAGELLPATLVETVWGNMTSAARQRLLAVPYRMATAALSADSFAAIETAAAELIREALNELHHYDPADYRPAVIALAQNETGLDVSTAAASDGEPVGGPASPVKQRVQRRTRPVAH
jgi:phage terminase Nu1 subunit (DNA packaging protein)